MGVMDIVGIDLSLTSTGHVVVPASGPVVTRRITSSGSKDASWDDRYVRMGVLAQRVANVTPYDSLVMLEAPAYSRTTGHQHDRSGLWWEVYRLLRGMSCQVIPVTPNIRAKYATGKGNASKDAVLAAVVKRYPSVDVTGNDVADALILAAIGARLKGAPLEESLPIAHRAALETLHDAVYSEPSAAP